MDDHWVTVSEALVKFMPKLGDFVADLGMFTDHSVLDDDFAWQVSMHHFPAGTSLKQLQHFAQNRNEDRFQVFSDKYHLKHGSGSIRETELYPLENMNVPIAIFQGIEDKIADGKDALWTVDQLGDNVIHYEDIHANHNTFAIGKDMTYFSETVIGLLNKYHPINVT